MTRPLVAACTTTALVLLAALLAIGPASAAPTHGCDGPPLPDVAAGSVTPAALLDSVGTPRPAVSYVFAVDLSRSMQTGGRYDEVRVAMRSFVDALCPGDRLAVVGFAERASTIVPLTEVSAVGDVSARLPEATGANTDVGAGLDLALREVDGVPAGQTTSVVLLTDGTQAAAPTSRYVDASSPGWADLRARAERAGRARPLRAFSIPLSGRTGSELMASALPQTQDLTVAGEGSLKDYLGRLDQDVRLQQAAPLLDRMPGPGVRVSWPPSFSDVDLGSGATTIGVVITNTSPVFPVTLEDPKLTSEDGFDVRSTPLPDVVNLPAGGSQVLPVRLSWTVPFRTSLVPGSGTYSTDLVLSGHVVSNTANGLAALVGRPDQAPTDGDLVDATGTMAGTAPVGLGLGWWLLLLVLVGIVGLAAALLSPRLRGTVTVVVTGPQARTAGGRLDLHRRRHHLSTDDEEPGRLDVPGADVRISVRGRRHRTGRVVRLRVHVRPRSAGDVAGTPRSASIDLPENGRRLVLGLEVQHRLGSVSAEHTSDSTTERIRR
ncbi:vWA domain-containing protein [Actinomycetospora termitidis]|uniref:VWA domain-containing protein n=1 Tax=Actinomycetospora termitidis TaxID=3053470 RepID=A0ABT7MEB2_9PSEU|nr:vWA domain-containing protein [Actinomycetospora sp. Odt1-22]MDL5158989.1 vWA domain-containing protein [Actinomycetospora sp. Odt1-22]